MQVYPIRLEPRLCARVWGGDRLARRFGRRLPAGPVGESWEVYGELPVANGPYRGLTLDELLRQEGEALVGCHCATDKGFPLLVKWLDCEDWLSIQVHPDDEVARHLTGDPAACGKTECWVIVEAAPEAELIHGLAEGSAPEDLDRDGVEVLPHVRRLHPQPGQVLFTPAGMVHALGPGLLLLEIQQSCDLTFRLYDWDRPGLDGQARPLHRAQAVHAARWSSGPTPVQEEGRVECIYFAVELVERSLTWSPEGRSFDLVALVEGRARLEADGAAEEMQPGDVLLVPASAHEVRLDLEPGSRAVRSQVPAPPEG